MKKDLFTYIAIFLVGTFIAYFACDLLFSSDSESVTIKTVGADISNSVDNPDPEVFNYRAINPTVEVYVGECSVYDSLGNCLAENVEIDGSVTKPEDKPDIEEDEETDEGEAEEDQNQTNEDKDETQNENQNQTNQPGSDSQNQNDDTQTQKSSSAQSVLEKSSTNSSAKGTANGSTN